MACRTSFPVSPGKSIQRLHHDVQHPRKAAGRTTVITILHVTLSAHPTKERKSTVEEVERAEKGRVREKGGKGEVKEEMAAV